MADIVLINGGVNLQMIQSATRYVPVGSGFAFSYSTDAAAAIPFYEAGVFSKLSVRVFSNAVTASSTVKTRINGADGNQSLSIPASTSGLFTDTSNTDTIASGDEVNLQFIVGAGGNRMNTSVLSMLFTPTTTPMVRYIVGGFNTNINGDSTTHYMPIGGVYLNNNTTEANSQVTFRTSGTIRNGLVNVGTNARATASTFRLRKNGGNGNISISIGAGVTGIIEDTSNTDTVTSGDVFNFALSTSTGGGNLNFIGSVEFVPDSHIGTYPIIGGSPTGGTIPASTTQYLGLASNLAIVAASTTESNLQMDTQTGWIARNMFCYVSSNAVSSGSTIARLRKNSGNGSSSISISAGATGYFEDTTNSDAISSTDDMTFSIAGGTGGDTVFNLLGVHDRYPITFNETKSAALTAVDSNAAIATFAAITSDSVTAVDVQAAGLTIPAAINESLAGADSQAAVATLNPVTSDSVTAAYNLLPGLVMPVSINENTAAADSQAADATFSASYSESLNGTDSLLAGLVMPASFNESITAGSDHDCGAEYENEIGESWSCDDSFALELTMNVAFSEAFAATDSYPNQIVFSADFAESLITAFLATLPIENLVPKRIFNMPGKQVLDYRSNKKAFRIPSKENTPRIS